MRHRGGRITATGMTRNVVFEPVKGPVNDRIEDAYRAKYKTNSYLKPMIDDCARYATVKIATRYAD
jgi:hypothetical protein